MARLKAKVEQVWLSVFEISPSPENLELYRPVLKTDPEIIRLAQSIRKHGILEPLIITRDNYILSGHRRYTAAKLAGLEKVPCTIANIVRNHDSDLFVTALREHNRQREKNFAEKLHEAVVSADPEYAYTALIEERELKSKVNVIPLELRGLKKRKEISKAKQPMLDAIVDILRRLEKYWPLSERTIHYNLLNDPPLRHASKPSSRYRNDKKSPHDLSDLVTRARLAGLIPFEAITDETRPVVIWNTNRDPSDFLQREMDDLLKNYWRDLLQSQPNHIEILVEKNTVASTLRSLAAQYCLPMTSGRGFASLPPRHDMAQRFRKSGKSKLVIILVSDFDPDGEEIAHSFGRSMRDDFGLDVVPVKAALTHAQVTRLRLHSSLEPKQTSKNYRRFVARYGPKQNVFELEAVPPDVLQGLVRETIDKVIDREMLNLEIRREKEDAGKIAGVRTAVLDLLKDVDFGAD